MKKCILLFMYAIVSMVASTVFASGTYTVGTGQTYTTLKAAFDAINNGTINGDIVLQLAANSSETSAGNSAFSLNNSGNISGANYTSILIYPTADNIIVQGNSNSTLVLTLNGADNVTIDGRKRDLNGIVLNQNIGLSFYGSAGTLTFTNDACSNTIKYCNIKNYGGNNPINFTPGTAVVTGNDNNNISYNNISGGSTSARKGIDVAAGTTGKENDNNTISYNNIFDVLAPGSNGYFIGLGAYNKNWTISNNSFYLTNSLTLTHTNANQVINLVAANNSGHIVENNYIGGNAPQCAGTMILDKSTASALPLDIITINKSALNESKIIVRNNTIKNIQIGANATGTVRGIVGVGVYLTESQSQTNEIDANFISNIEILGTENIIGINVGTNGHFSITNNVVSLISNGTGIYYGIYDDTNNSSLRYIYNNTIYVGGTTTSANNSITYYYLNNGSAARWIKNNIFVNTRSNSGTGKNYVVWYNSTATNATPAYNIYHFSGTNSVLARYNGTDGTDVSSLPILSGKDANSVVVDPVLTISSPTVLTDYRSTISQVTSGGASDYTVSKDIQGNTRIANQKGAFFIPTGTSLITGATTATAFTTTYGTVSTAQSFAISGSSLTENVTATAPTGFEVSSNGTDYGRTASFIQTGGNASGNLSIRLKANAVVSGYYNSQNIVLSSSGTSSISILTASNGNIVTAKALTITGIGISNKAYDGGTTASITGTAAYIGLVNSESFTVTGTPAANFASATVGNTKSVTVSGYTAPSSNYSISQPTGLTANITAAPLTITGISIANKEYDGTTTATIAGTAAYSGLVNSESFTVTGTPAAAFADASVGNAKSITVSGYTAPNSNYSITQPTGLTANITAAPVSLNPGAGNSASATSYTVEQLANSNIVVSSGEFIVDRATVNVQSITVAPGAKLTLGANTLTTTNGITLQSNENGTATLTGDNAVTNATVQQYVTAGRNWYISPSVTAAPYNALNRGKGGLDGIVEYNEIEGRWDNVTSGTLVKGKGYIQVASASAPGSTGVVQFEGTTNTGNVSVTLSRTADKGKGFNLVGNPYPSYLDWTMAATANPNVLPTAWFRTQKTAGAGGGYGFATVNAENPATPEIVSNNANTDITKYIPPMQAYWVRLIESPLTTTYTVTNAMRAHIDAAGNSTGNTFKAPKASERSRLRLQLVNGIESDEALIYFDQAALNSFDRYDSPKMMNNSAVMPDLYTKAGTERLVINGLNAVSDNLELPLGFTLKNAAASLKLSVSELSNFSPDTKVYLIDRAKNVQTELTAGTEYSFDITEAAIGNESRFALLFRAPNAPNALDNPENINVKVYVNVANQIVIDSPVSSKYAIYNAVGQLIENGKTTTQLQTANCQLPTGLFVVKVNNQSTRVVIK